MYIYRFTCMYVYEYAYEYVCIYTHVYVMSIINFVYLHVYIVHICIARREVLQYFYIHADT